MGRIVKPFGRVAVRVEVTQDDNNQLAIKGEAFPLVGPPVSLNPIQICALLSQTVASTLAGAVLGKKGNGNDGEKQTDGNNGDVRGA